jgi:hypothetical protein
LFKAHVTGQGELFTFLVTSPNKPVHAKAMAGPPAVRTPSMMISLHTNAPVALRNGAAFATW